MNYNKAEFYTSFGKFSQIPKSDRLEFAFPAGRMGKVVADKQV